MATVSGTTTGGTPGTSWGTPFPVNVPAGTANGDLLIAVNASEWGSLASNAVPAGFTRLTTSEFDGGANGIHISIGWRTASSEPASYTFASAADTANVGAIFRITGHAAAVQVAQAAAAVGLTAPSVVPNGASDLLMTFHVSRTSGSTTMTWTPPTGMTEHVDLTRGDYISLHAASLAAPPNPTGTRTATQSFSDQAVSAAISIAGDVAPTRTGRVKVWDGAQWVSKPIRVWDGASWVEKPLKVWDGSQWITAK